MNTIFIEGSSTAKGWGSSDHTKKGWANHVTRLMPSYNVANLSVVGSGIKAINQKWEADQKWMSQYGQLGLLRILQTGLMESRIVAGATGPRMPLEVFAQHVKEYSEATKAANMLTMYVGSQLVNEAVTTPIEDTGWTALNAVTLPYFEVLRQQAEVDSVPYVDVVAEFAKHDGLSLLSEDGRYPNNKGHLLIGQQVTKAAAELGL